MLFEPIFQHAAARPNDVAIVDDRGQFTWGQLAAAVAGLGQYLQMQTRQPRVGILLPTSGAFVASFYGTLVAGKTAVPINFLLSDREIAHCIADSGIDTIITMPLLAAKLKDAPLKVIDITALPTPPAGAIAPKLPSPAPDDIAAILYTSGTSGLPKGVMLTYANIHGDVEACIEHVGLKGSYNFLGIIPLFHSTGMLATMVAPIRLGSKMIYQARFSPVAVAQAIKQHEVNLIGAVPSMYGAIARLKDVAPDDMKSLFFPISGGEPLSAVIREGFRQRFNIPIMEGYGLTETCGPVCVNTPQQHRPGAVGKLFPGTHVKIVDDNGQALPTGEAGEVWLKGPMIMKGYLNHPEATANVLTADGYFKTGDIGKVDDDGYLFITGRKKDIIIVAGEKAYPGEIEEIVARTPGVAEVAVVGKKDPSRGEVVCAFVVAREGQSVSIDQIRETCRAAGLPQWKIPREVMVVTELPRSPTGKVLKRVLSDQINAPTT